MNKERLEELDDDDDNNIPTTNSQSIEDWEIDNGRGFWGNNEHGYTYDKDMDN